MRALSSPAAAALASNSATLCMLIEMLFTGGPLRLNTSLYDLANPDSPADIYTGVGLIGQIDAISDKVKDIQGIQLSLSGVDTAIIAIALGEQVRGRPLNISLAVLSSTTHAVLDVTPMWSGTMSTMAINQKDNTASVVISAEHRGVLFSRPKPVRYTDTDQQLLFPGDRCLEYVVSQSQTQDIWPAAAFFKQ